MTLTPRFSFVAVAMRPWMAVRDATGDGDHIVGVDNSMANAATVHPCGIDDQMAVRYATMRPEEELPIPARSSVTFAPGGLP